MKTREHVSRVKYMGYSDYYRGELSKLVWSDYGFSVQLFDGLGNKTKCIQLNEDSVLVLLEFLKKIK